MNLAEILTREIISNTTARKVERWFIILLLAISVVSVLTVYLRHTTFTKQADALLAGGAMTVETVIPYPDRSLRVYLRREQDTTVERVVLDVRPTHPDYNSFSQLSSGMRITFDTELRPYHPTPQLLWPTLADYLYLHLVEFGDRGRRE